MGHLTATYSGMTSGSMDSALLLLRLILLLMHRRPYGRCSPFGKDNTKGACLELVSQGELEYAGLATPVQNRQIDPVPVTLTPTQKKNKAKTKSNTKTEISHQSAGLYPTSSRPLANVDLGWLQVWRHALMTYPRTRTECGGRILSTSALQRCFEGMCACSQKTQIDKNFQNMRGGRNRITSEASCAVRIGLAERDRSRILLMEFRA